MTERIDVLAVVDGDIRTFEFLLRITALGISDPNDSLSRSRAARAAVAELIAALRIARKHMAHKAACCTVRPSSEWPEHGSLNFGECSCDIRTVDTALARVGGAP